MSLGLSCPDGGTFYTCDKGVTRFIGCCTVDPCGNGLGQCPTEHLRISSFSSDSYMDIPAQSCVTPYDEQKWYTCSAKPPFLGCCKSNPCSDVGCPDGDLLPARLSDNSTNAQAFIDAAKGTSNSSSGSSLPLGVILGASLGGAALLAIIVGFMAYRCGWFARRRREERSSADEGAKLYESTPGSALYSPGFTNDWHDHQLRSDAGSPAPMLHPNQTGKSQHSPGFSPYSPRQYYSMYSDAPSDQDTRHSRHVSAMSMQTPHLSEFGGPAELGPSESKHMSLSSVPLMSQAAYGDNSGAKSPPFSSSPPRGGVGYAMELEGQETERARPISELPGHDMR